jgi:ATP-dependent Lon protease
MNENRISELVSPEIIGTEEDRPISTPKQVSVLPVRDTVLFPHAVLPLTIGRESSVELLQSLGEDKLIVVAAQKDSSEDNPRPADLYASMK